MSEQFRTPEEREEYERRVAVLCEQPMTTKPTSATPKERFNALREGWDEHTSDGEMYSGLRNLFLEVVDELEQMRKERDSLKRENSGWKDLVNNKHHTLFHEIHESLSNLIKRIEVGE